MFRTNKLLKGVTANRASLRIQLMNVRSQLHNEIQSRVFWETLAVDMAAEYPAGADMIRSRMEALNALTAEELLDVSTEEE